MPDHDGEPDDYLSIVISDIIQQDRPEPEQKVKAEVSSWISDNSPLHPIAQLLLDELKTGGIDIAHDDSAQGDAMITIELKPSGEMEAMVLCHPSGRDPENGDLSGGQALAFSALNRLQDRIADLGFGTMRWNQQD